MGKINKKSLLEVGDGSIWTKKDVVNATVFGGQNKEISFFLNFNLLLDMLHKYKSYKHIKIIFNTIFILVFIFKFFRYIMILGA